MVRNSSRVSHRDEEKSTQAIDAQYAFPRARRQPDANSVTHVHRGRFVLTVHLGQCNEDPGRKSHWHVRHEHVEHESGTRQSAVLDGYSGAGAGCVQLRVSYGTYRGRVSTRSAQSEAKEVAVSEARSEDQGCAGRFSISH